MIASSRNYAIGMVHFKIGGGWLVTGIILGVYLLLFFGVISTVYYAEFRSPGVIKDIGRGILGFIMALQGLALLGVGGYRVSAAIRSDISSRMLESHRLMPITSGRAVLGYMFGPPTPTVAFVLLNLLLSLAFGNWMGGSLERLVLNQFVIFTFAVFAWSALALGTFIYRHMFIISFTAMILGMCTGMATGAYFVLPALSLILTPLLGESVFSLGGGMGFGPSTTFDMYAVGIAGQAVFFYLFFLASCRLYRGTYATAFNFFQALALLGTWAFLSTWGIAHPADVGLGRFMGGLWGPQQPVGAVQIIGSLVSGILIAMVPMWSVMRKPVQKPTPLWHQGVLVLGLSVLATVPAYGAMWMDNYGVRALAITLLVVLTQIVIVYCLLWLVRRLVFILAALVIVGAMFALNLLPLILEMVRMNLGGNSSQQQVSALLTLSPMGLVATEWMRGVQGAEMDVSPVIGCIWQVLVAGMVLGVTALISRRKSKPVSEAVPAGGPATADASAVVAVPPVVMPVAAGPSSGGSGPGPV